MSKNITTKKLRPSKDERRRLFVSLGLRPLQIALSIALWAYVLSMASGVFYYWSQKQLLGWLVVPAILVYFWSFHFRYIQREIRGIAIATGVSLVLDIRHLAWDDFTLVGSVARVLVVIFALLISAKMKDPIFSTPNGA